MIEVEIDDPAWTSALPQAETIVERAVEAALDAFAPSEVEAPVVAVLLAGDETVADLNQRFRGKAGLAGLSRRQPRRRLSRRIAG